MKIFIICPVRNTTEEEKLFLADYVYELESSGAEVHYPPRDTDQNDDIGWNICTENYNAILNADEVHIYWKKGSEGSLFDLGMTFALEKPLLIINESEVKETPYKSFENLIIYWDADTF